MGLFGKKGDRPDAPAKKKAGKEIFCVFQKKSLAGPGGQMRVAQDHAMDALRSMGELESRYCKPHGMKLKPVTNWCSGVADAAETKEFLFGQIHAWLRAQGIDDALIEKGLAVTERENLCVMGGESAFISIGVPIHSNGE